MSGAAMIYSALSWIELVKRTESVAALKPGNMQVNEGGSEVFMPEELSKGIDIHAIFEQMRGITVSEGMNGSLFIDTSKFKGLPHGPLNPSGR